jgi:hypothetical protein
LRQPRACESELALDRRAADHGEGDALRDVGGRDVHRAEERRAHRARPLALGPVHPEVADERVVLAEQVGEADRLAGLVGERIVARRAPGRQGAAPRGDALDLAPEIDLPGEQRGARLAVSALSLG